MSSLLFDAIRCVLAKASRNVWNVWNDFAIGNDGNEMPFWGRFRSRRSFRSNRSCRSLPEKRSCRSFRSRRAGGDHQPEPMSEKASRMHSTPKAIRHRPIR